MLGMMRLSRCWRSSLERPSLRPPLARSKRSTRLQRSRDVEAGRVTAGSVGVASTGRDRHLSCARDTGEAVHTAFLRSGDEHTRDAEPSVYGPRGAGCRPPTRKGRTSAGGFAQQDSVPHRRRAMM